MKRLLIAATAAAMISSCCQSGPKVLEIISDESTVAQTIYGPVAGYSEGGIFAFKGIQYAKAERFMPPQFPDRHTETVPCKIYGPVCPQGQNFRWSDSFSEDNFGFQFRKEAEDENCQVLNVWTPGLNDGKKRPVFVWFHGGGYFSGSSSNLPCYDGRALAEKGDIVVVTVNHRLNVLGYIDLSGLGGKYSESVNLGQQDLVKSLEWIRDNIEFFGGDPGCVTIAGQSGGGGKVGLTLAMPSAKGLVHRAIIQSGPYLSASEQPFTQECGLEFVRQLGLDQSNIDTIKDIPYEELTAAWNRASQVIFERTGRRASQDGVVDGKYITEQLFEGVCASPGKDVPLMIGSNLNEFNYANHIKISEDQLFQRLQRSYGDDAARYIETYKRIYPDWTLEKIAYTDISFRARSVMIADAKAASGGADCYMYLFKWQSPVCNGAMGACHGMELPFVFNNVELQREMTGGGKDALRVEKFVTDAWIAFIKTGNPNAAHLPKWDPYTAESGACMVFDIDCEVRHHHDKELCAFFNMETMGRR